MPKHERPPEEIDPALVQYISDQLKLSEIIPDKVRKALRTLGNEVLEVRNPEVYQTARNTVTMAIISGELTPNPTTRVLHVDEEGQFSTLELPFPSIRIKLNGQKGQKGFKTIIFPELCQSPSQETGSYEFHSIRSDLAEMLDGLDLHF